MGPGNGLQGPSSSSQGDARPSLQNPPPPRQPAVTAAPGTPGSAPSALLSLSALGTAHTLVRTLPTSPRLWPWLRPPSDSVMGPDTVLSRSPQGLGLCLLVQGRGSQWLAGGWGGLYSVREAIVTCLLKSRVRLRGCHFGASHDSSVCPYLSVSHFSPLGCIC